MVDPKGQSSDTVHLKKEKKIILLSSVKNTEKREVTGMFSMRHKWRVSGQSEAGFTRYCQGPRFMLDSISARTTIYVALISHTFKITYAQHLYQ